MTAFDVTPNGKVVMADIENMVSILGAELSYKMKGVDNVTTVTTVVKWTKEGYLAGLIHILTRTTSLVLLHRKKLTCLATLTFRECQPNNFIKAVHFLQIKNISLALVVIRQRESYLISLHREKLSMVTRSLEDLKMTLTTVGLEVDGGTNNIFKANQDEIIIYKLVL